MSAYECPLAESSLYFLKYSLTSFVGNIPGEDKITPPPLWRCGLFLSLCKFSKQSFFHYVVLTQPNLGKGIEKRTVAKKQLKKESEESGCGTWGETETATVKSNSLWWRYILQSYHFLKHPYTILTIHKNFCIRAKWIIRSAFILVCVPWSD